MDLVIGDSVRIVSNINVSFMLPGGDYLYYILYINEICDIIYKDDVKEILLVNNRLSQLGAEIPYSYRTKLVKIS